jgi:hypothetical protein
MLLADAWIIDPSIFGTSGCFTSTAGMMIDPSLATVGLAIIIYG